MLSRSSEMKKEWEWEERHLLFRKSFIQRELNQVNEQIRDVRYRMKVFFGEGQ